MPNVSRKRGESFEAMMRRFKLHILKSGFIDEIKEKRFRRTPKSEAVKRASALVRMQWARRMQYLRKIGKVKEGQRNVR